MNKIKFSHYYMKMPKKQFLTASKHEVFQIFVCDAKELNPQYVRWDTAYEKDDGSIEYFELPKGKVIVIYLLTSNKKFEQAWSWQTIRRWTPEKERYYRELMGKEVKVVIEEGGDKT